MATHAAAEVEHDAGGAVRCQPRDRAARQGGGVALRVVGVREPADAQVSGAALEPLARHAGNGSRGENDREVEGPSLPFDRER